MTDQQRRTPSGSARTIRVFISSTFRDMFDEREELVKRVFPQLRKLCEERGVTWGEVDLRWGITREQAERGEVLAVCLEEIQRCRPYFIGLLGERYGWVPDEIPQELIEREAWLSGRRDHSVTELEILHGVLNDPLMAEHAFFYFRDPSFSDRVAEEERKNFREMPTPEDEARFGHQEAVRRAAERADKLAALKQRIRTSGFPVRENFKDARALGQFVLEDLTALIERLYPRGSEPDEIERTFTEHETFAESLTRVYVPHPDDFNRLSEYASSSGGPPLVVTGQSGSGKSALLANWALAYRRAHPETLVVMHFVGTIPLSTLWQGMFYRIMSELRRHFHIGLEVPDTDQLIGVLESWLEKAAARGRLVIVIDALERLDDRSAGPELLWLPTKIPPGVRFIFSTMPGRPLDELERRGCSTLALEPLSEAERQKLIEEYLAQYTKRLSASHAQRIVSANAAGNPLYLRALLEELRLYGEHETLEERINYYLEAQTAPALYQKILERYEQDYERERAHLVRDAASLIWAARRGLSEAELLDMLGTDDGPLPRAYWSPLYLSLETSLINLRGLFSFSQDYLRQAVGERYLDDEELRRAAHKRLADYFASRELSQRKIDELPWQLANAEDWEALHDLLSDLEFFKGAWGDNPYEVQSYWAQIEANTRLRLIDSYRDVLENPGRYTEYLSDLARLFIDTGHHREALALRENLIEHYREAEESQNLQTELIYRANLLLERGDLIQAAAVLEEEEQLARTAGRSQEQEILALHSRAILLRARGELREALALMQEVERLAREQENKSALGKALLTQASIMQRQNDPDGALATYEEVERIGRELGDLETLQHVLFNRANLLELEGRVEEAISLLAELERQSRETGEKRLLAASLVMQSSFIAKSGGDRAMAEEKCREAISLFRELEMPGQEKEAVETLRVIEADLNPHQLKVLMLLFAIVLIAAGVALGLWRPWLWLLGGPLALMGLLFLGGLRQVSAPGVGNILSSKGKPTMKATRAEGYINRAPREDE